jgi:glucose-fructose oxidoreductase
MLPAFAQAENSELVALFSSDPVKRDELGENYGIEHVYDYDAFDRVLSRGVVDAVYIALPNHLHCEYTERAARHGVHVLCEKPMAVDERECERMIRATEDAKVQLMVAYRLHFDPANLDVIEMVGRGEIGEPRIFQSEFTQNVQAGNVRLAPVDRGGGPVYDLGVYCINAARYIFREEPFEVTAFAVSPPDPRFRDCPETVAVTLRFPQQRVANFVTSFGTTKVSRYSVIGTKGRVTMEPAYEYAIELAMQVETEDDERETHYEKHDQFAPQLVYFSECILQNRRPEPDGLSGLADVHIVRGIHESARLGAPVRLLPIRQHARPERAQCLVRPPIEKPEEIHAQSPSGG